MSYIVIQFWLVLFNIRVSKGVRDLPGNLQSATSTVPSGKALMYFGLLLATGVFFVFIAFTMFLPIMVLMPQKFAICFTLGCGLIIGSFFALRGPKNQLTHMSSKEVCLLYYRLNISCYTRGFYTEWKITIFFIQLYISNAFFSHFLQFIQRLPFTLGFLGSMIGTIYVSMVLHSYILSVLFSVIQV